MWGRILDPIVHQAWEKNESECQLWKRFAVWLPWRRPDMTRPRPRSANRHLPNLQMLKAVLILVLVCSLGGCRQLQPFPGEPPTARPTAGDPAALRDVINEQAARHTATVYFFSRQPTRAEALRMDADSTSWLDPETRQPDGAATSDVSRVRFPGHRLGAGEGIVGGFMGGIVVGAVLFYSTPGGPGSGSQLGSPRFYAGYMAAGLGLLGAAIGGLASAGSGGDVVYVLETPRD